VPQRENAKQKQGIEYAKGAANDLQKAWERKTEEKKKVDTIG
jgi:hypothetical protein